MKKILLGILVVSLTLSVGTPAVAKKGGGGNGGGGGKPGGGDAPLCFAYSDAAGERVGSDGLGAYCHDKRAKIQAVIGSGGHIKADTNTSNKVGVGRELFVDFGEVVSIGGTVPCGEAFGSTVDLDLAGIPHDATFGVGLFRDDVNLRSMALGEVRADVNFRIALFIHPADRPSCALFIRFDPGVLERSCTPNPDGPDSTYVEVECLEAADGECTRWSIDSGSDGMACVGLDGGGAPPLEFYNLPFSATVWRSGS